MREVFVPRFIVLWTEPPRKPQVTRREIPTERILELLKNKDSEGLEKSFLASLPLECEECSDSYNIRTAYRMKDAEGLFRELGWKPVPVIYCPRCYIEIREKEAPIESVSHFNGRQDR